MPEGLDVDLPALRETAVAMRNDAGTIDTATHSGGDVLDSVDPGAGNGPLAGVANVLSGQMTSALAASCRNVEATAAALNAAAGNHESADAAASRRLQLPGF